MPDEVEFRTKPQIALEQIDRALGNGIEVSAWTFDELYGRDGQFLNGLESRGQVFVGEIPRHFHGWTHFLIASDAGVARIDSGSQFSRHRARLKDPLRRDN